MPIVAWDNSYRVNIYEIDAQHKKLIDLVNTLYDAMKEGKSNDVLESSLNALMAFTQIHFTAEERLMAQNNYRDLINHKIQHQHFFAKIQEFRNKFQSDHFALSFEVLQFLSAWLINHFQKTDKQYTELLHSVEMH